MSNEIIINEISVEIKEKRIKQGKKRETDEGYVWLVARKGEAE